MKVRMTRGELMDWAADHYDTVQDCYGNPDQALMAGWVNAMYMDEERGGISDREFVDAAYAAYDNMGYHLVGRMARDAHEVK